MRYLLQNLMDHELEARKAYIYSTLSLWTIPYDSSDGFVTLQSIPTNALDTLFIVGHNYAVTEYLSTHEIQESCIVIISCYKNLFINKTLLHSKRIYISRQNSQKESGLYNGHEYGFMFNPTESELMLYNNRNSLNFSKRLEAAFQRIK